MWADAEELYSSKYDYINVDEIMANDRQREQYYKCFMDLAPCKTPDAIFYKGHLFEAFTTKCKKCTEMQKQNLEKLVEWYSKNKPDQWNAYLEKVLKDAKGTE
ncbi:Ejaculatory bulb-specific protein 3 [Habropoda laboriosa]|uniref:Ejaculatory bulb-specific protein 3 n=2 Tax=Habropoda laboriosa TaxID=597456 RepID=A0A0L7R0M5_9HYME|nr:Ejaculatory bulb-specific protein 3 [Habropoda laboriosa]